MVGDHSSNPRGGGAVAFVKARVVHRSSRHQADAETDVDAAEPCREGQRRTARVALKGVVSRPRALCVRFRSRSSPAFFSFWFAFGFIFTLTLCLLRSLLFTL